MSVADAHARQERSTSETSEEVPSVIAKRGNLDQRFHEDCYNALVPFVTSAPAATWLTIGDSGGDAYWLRERGAQGRIVASSITLEQLEKLKRAGSLDTIEITAVNAEKIDYPEESFDFVLCKEAFHHFPRPMVGFYEMMRVCKIGLVFVAEPNGAETPRLLDQFRLTLKKLLRRNSIVENSDFELSGNYIYALSRFEIFKAQTALQLGPLYYCYSNAFWTMAVCSRSQDDVIASFIMRLGVAIQDLGSQLGLMNWGRLSLLALKQEPSSDLDRNLRAAGYKRVDIPVNPYL